ncbi:MAG: hypothetical protein GX945_00185 [Lentisphaerae bacterium]|nr:hypothetical protein [Lentisphaerota bacterium]
MTCYLYGASVQGIQRFIFESTRLREIAGASELVESLCTSCFDEIKGDADCIIQAAGNIRAIFRRREELERVARLFPKIAMERAPGVSVVQAVVAFTGELQKATVDTLERDLKTASPSVAPGDSWSVSARAPRSGRCAVRLHKDKKNPAGELQDIATVQKLAAVSRAKLKQKFGLAAADPDFPMEIDDIADSGNYVAIIHADGNSLGQTLAKLSAEENYSQKWHQFSLSLDEATKAAAQRAFTTHFKDHADYQDKKSLPFRPIILGGDDLTVICAASKGIDFTRDFLQAFAEECLLRQDALGKALTACAGIAFVKKSYPFHFGVELAEQLCAQAKKVAKASLTGAEPVPSSFMFHRELGSFVEDSFESIAKRELNADGLSFAFGPYRIDDSPALPPLAALLAGSKAILAAQGDDVEKGHNPLRNGLREYQSEVYNNVDNANFLLDRLETVSKEANPGALRRLQEALATLVGKEPNAALRELVLCERDGRRYSPVNDLLIASQFWRPPAAAAQQREEGGL